ncbi:HET-domain-containing protein [Trametes versicolor FP-101664 SS1]|uniref:HET-domain-containing protein n=1 Tax=Trametes versicolor (strain FP-101664) TaxID=717944 RepID=R7S7M3_TRAVS|nr:HET-domain-containing protein [Trametes versicolor FP-101664 SS1]EIW52001.1 HET-domain-containing protein [Trametes versicolor FP-101664 SS1]
MRLIDTETGQFHVVSNEFQVPYAILSHTWDPQGEQTFQDKIRRSCAVAREAGYKWLWIDSCCIDKTSSSELSEAIKSMYVWYKHSAVCFAFLPDVSGEDELAAEKSEFRRSRWFTRGWTLQELIAPGSTPGSFAAPDQHSQRSNSTQET